ncbi:hypothetical protein FPRO04_07500 [Fusarium proliferatum]|nr:hypothetical protein FPRO03_13131 [Fusarium proliferatum]KAG4277203.1 hypothetical protein FPRO04_07500 [Fusarium proliferatum]
MRRRSMRKRRASGELSRNGTNLSQIEPASASDSQSDRALASRLRAEEEHLWEDLDPKALIASVKKLNAAANRLEAAFGDLKSNFSDLIQTIRNTNPAVDRHMESMLPLDIPSTVFGAARRDEESRAASQPELKSEPEPQPTEGMPAQSISKQESLDSDTDTSWKSEKQESPPVALNSLLTVDSTQKRDDMKTYKVSRVPEENAGTQTPSN